MRMYDIIKKKRDGYELSDEEIEYTVNGYVDGSIPDYQMSALLMAIYFKGMNIRETTTLTMSMRNSGEILHFTGINGIRVDKHSTGGVGDKTSLVVAPIVASLGVKVAKMSGRGLGHTGGTVDKLESIEGFKTDLSIEEFESAVNEVGIAIVGQSATLAPADKKLYALRDVTATVDSMPLIASSIMSKKLASDDDCIVLDVKTGSGSFMKTVEDSKKLAELMVGIGKRAGKKMMALITDMDRPLGNAIGNSLEVIEAIDTLKGHGPKDFKEICTDLSADMLCLAGFGTADECRKKVINAVQSGKAFDTFVRMVNKQGGNVDWITNTNLFPKAEYAENVVSDKDGFITHVDTEGYGIASLILGAGRNVKEDKIDYSAGIMLKKKTGDYVKKGDVIAVLYTNDKGKIGQAKEKLLCSTYITNEKVIEKPVVLAKIQ